MGLEAFVNHLDKIVVIIILWRTIKLQFPVRVVPACYLAWFGPILNQFIFQTMIMRQMTVWVYYGDEYVVYINDSFSCATVDTHYQHILEVCEFFFVLAQSFRARSMSLQRLESIWTFSGYLFYINIKDLGQSDCPCGFSLI